MQLTDKLNGIKDEIQKVSRTMRRFRDGPLSDRCVVVLLHDATKLPIKTIERVLKGLDSLEDLYLKEDK